jgi:hypothetical protein
MKANFALHEALSFSASLNLQAHTVHIYSSALSELELFAGCISRIKKYQHVKTEPRDSSLW